MNKYLSPFVLFILIAANIIVNGQQKNKGVFIESKNPFFDEVLQGIEDFEKEEKPPVKSFRMDFTGMQLPKSVDEFTKYIHSSPVSQGNTGTCWSFSATSFFESEVYRLHKKEIKISQLFTVYWEYVEKAKGFIASRGKSNFAEGSEANAVKRIYNTFGAVPLSAYSGLLPGQKFHNHSKMFEEMKSFLNSIKEKNAWDEESVTATIKSILNYYLGVPPAEFEYEGKNYTPKTFLNEYLQIIPDDYVDVLSYMQQPFYKQVEYEVPDNWWHDKSYYNVPLDEYMKAIKQAVRDGYTVCIGGDVSEPGRDNNLEVFVVPSFDIPAEYIDDNARQMRFSNETTTDDHGIHLIGYKEDKGKDWFLIKDSGAGSFVGPNKGYFFYHEDYVKLKIMDFMVHKDAVKDLLTKFQ